MWRILLPLGWGPGALWSNSTKDTPRVPLPPSTTFDNTPTFSGDGRSVAILPFVRKVLSDYGYQLDPRKTNLFRKGRRQVVTGLVVNQKPNLARPLRRRLRAAVHHRMTGRDVTWRDKPMRDDELNGWISFLNLVQPKEAAKLWRCLEESH